MEKKLKIITQEVWLFFKKKQQSIPIQNYIISEPTLQNIPPPTTKKSTIYIYDISHKTHKNTNTIISINNHINKTGENILRNTKTNKTNYKTHSER